MINDTSSEKCVIIRLITGEIKKNIIKLNKLLSEARYS